MQLLKRVFQVVFEVASCAKQDHLSSDNESDEPEASKLPVSFSLKTPTSVLFPKKQTHNNSPCEVAIRAMLLRAQYGGMKCDVDMLHSYATVWVGRFQSESVPTSFANCLASETTTSQSIYWSNVPNILHAKAREKSEVLVSSEFVSAGVLQKLSPTDVCSAGIDFHCSSVVEHLLSQRELYISLSERLTQLKNGDKTMVDREWMSGQLASMIWNYSSGINHRRSLLMGESESKKMDSSDMKNVWSSIIKVSFDCYTRKFVRDRLA